MADPLSTTASIVGITVPALHAIRLLSNDLQQLIDAPKTIQQLRDDLSATETAVTSLQGIKDQDWEALSGDIAKNTNTIIDLCQKACESFRIDLQRWTRHSKDGRLGWQDRATVGFFKDNQIKTMSEQLQNCKLTITSIVSIAVLYGSIRQGHIVENVQNTLNTRQAEITRAIGAAESQSTALENQMAQLRLSVEKANHSQGTDGATGALQQSEEGRKALTASLELLHELLLKSKTEEFAKVAVQEQNHTTMVTFGDKNSGFQAGIINGSVSGITFGNNKNATAIARHYGYNGLLQGHH